VSSTLSRPGTGMTKAEPICFEAGTRAQAESLQEELAAFEPRVVRGTAGWLVELNPDERVSSLLLTLFHSVSRWLSRNHLAFVEVHFGESRYTLLHPSDARPSHSAEFLLQRVIQLERALDSRVVIEQAKGLLAGKLRLAVDDAFEVIRLAARGAGRGLRELAQEVVRAEALPAEIERALESWRPRG
jgi:hypothetical protein